MGADVAAGIPVELHDSEMRELLDRLLLRAPIGLAFLDRNLRYVRANETLARFDGIALADHLGRTVREVLPALAPELEPLLRQVLDTGRPILDLELETGETRALPGRRRSWVVSYYPVADPGGGPPCGIGMLISEVTERRRAEEALRRSEAHLRLALDASDMGVWDWDLRTGRVDWNEHHARIFGLAGSADFAGSYAAFEQLVVPADRGLVEAAVARALANRGTYAAEFRICRPDRKIRLILARGQVLLDEAGQPTRMIGVVLDVTDSRTAEQRLAATFEHITDAFFALDRQWRFTYLNRTAERMLRRGRAELLGQQIWAAFPRAVGTAFHERYEQAMTTGEPAEFEAYYPPYDTWFEVRAYPDEESLSVYFRDVTERRALEAERLAQRAHEAEEAARAARLAELEAALAQVRRASRREQAFADIAATVAYAGSLEQTLHALARAVVDATDMPACAVLLIDGEPLAARVVGTSGLPADYSARFDAAWRAHAAIPALEAFRTQRAVVVAEARDDPALGGRPDVPWRGLVCLPLVARGRSVGVLKVLYPVRSEPDEAGVGFLQTLADQAAVAVDNARLLAAAREKAAMEERHRLARELHDSITQSLFSMTLLSRAAQLALHRAGVDVEVSAGAAAGTALADLQELSQTALAEMRALLFELRPGALTEEGLLAGLRKHATALQAREKIAVEVHGPAHRTGLRPVDEEELYRIATEALTNVVKHAGATRAAVQLLPDPVGGSGWVLEIRDDGVGFEPGSLRPGHLGLSIMAERAERLGGRLDVLSTPRTGTVVRVTVPLRAPGGAA